MIVSMARTTTRINYTLALFSEKFQTAFERGINIDKRPLHSDNTPIEAYIVLSYFYSILTRL